MKVAGNRTSVTTNMNQPMNTFLTFIDLEIIRKLVQRGRSPINSTRTYLHEIFLFMKTKGYDIIDDKVSLKNL